MKIESFLILFSLSTFQEITGIASKARLGSCQLSIEKPKNLAFVKMKRR